MSLEEDLSRPLFMSKPVDPGVEVKLARNSSPLYSGSWTYALGYKLAADTLVEEYGKSYPYFWETHIYPICFLYRHSFEVAIKELIRTYLKILDRPVDGSIKDLLEKRHSLERLHAEGVKLSYEIEGANGKVGDKRVKLLVGERLDEIEAVDPNSFSFRYPTDASGKTILLKDGWTIELNNLRQSAHAVWRYLEVSYGLADELLRMEAETGP